MAQMQPKMKQLLRPFARRIRRQTWLRRFGVCACAAVGAGILLLLASFFVPIPNALGAAATLAAAICLVSGVALAVWRPRPEALAAEIDRCGFQERVQTMQALQGDSSDFAALQRADTFAALQSADPKERVPIRAPRRPYALAAAGVFVAFALAILPSPQDELLREREEIRQVMREQAEKVEAGLEAVRKDESLRDAEKAELNEQLRELAKMLREGKDYKESVKQISGLQQKLGEIRKEQSRQQMNSLQSALEKRPATKDLAERLEDKQPEEAAEELRQAAKEAREEQQKENGDSEKTKDLKEALEEAAENAGDDGVKEALEELAEAVEQGDEAAAEAALEALEDAMNGASQSGGVVQLGDNLRLAKSRMSQLSQTTGFTGDPSQLTATPQDGQSGQSDQNGQSGQSGGT